MQSISDMPDDDFMKLQELYGADLPICRRIARWRMHGRF